VLFDDDRTVGELEDLFVAEAESCPIGLGRRDIAGRDLRAAFDEHHLHRLVAQQAAKHRPMPLREGGLVNVELIGVDGPLDDVLAQPYAPVMNTTSRKPDSVSSENITPDEARSERTIFMTPIDNATS